MRDDEHKVVHVPIDKDRNEMEAHFEAHVTKEPTRPSFLGIGLAVLLATATFFSGLHIGGTDARLEASVGSFFNFDFGQGILPSDEPDLSNFWHVWNLLDEKFVSSTTTAPKTDEDRIRGAIDGLVRSYGDPYTVYMPPEDASIFEQDISGNFSGVGMEVGMRDDMITIISPLPNTPAEKAGLIAGDVIIRIDGSSTEGMSIDEAVQRIRGEKGTTVAFQIFRKGEEEFRDISVVRETIAIPTSKVEEKGDAFIIALYSFNAIAEAEMQDALRKFVESGKKNLILDLRGNPGGYLEGAVSIASHFLPVGKVVVRESFGEGVREQVYRSAGRTLGDHSPGNLVVLVDGGSASASEILAGALKEHGIATLIGTQTFGKGSVQELVALEDGSSLKVTIARWLTPNGVSILNGGLTPDVVVERTPEDREAGKDPQLDAALEYFAHPN